MTNAKRDNNSITVKLGVLQSDGVTPTPLQANGTTHVLKTANGTSGTDQSAGKNAQRDQNSVPTMMALSSDGLGTPVLLYLDASNNLLIKST